MIPKNCWEIFAGFRCRQHKTGVVKRNSKLPDTVGLSFQQNWQRVESSRDRKVGNMRNRSGKRPPKGAEIGIMKKSVILKQRMSQ